MERRGAQAKSFTSILIALAWHAIRSRPRLVHTTGRRCAYRSALRLPGLRAHASFSVQFSTGQHTRYANSWPWRHVARCCAVFSHRDLSMHMRRYLRFETARQHADTSKDPGVAFFYARSIESWKIYSVDILALCPPLWVCPA